jgi:MFS transporter, PAT family, beta-lactamase induction signal transducer AmpG
VGTIKDILFNKRMLICVFTGFSSGLPLFILISLLPAWLRSEGVSLKAIGLLALILFPYTWKFLWAPLLDRYTLPLGRRRGWMLLTQVVLLASLFWFGTASPSHLTAPEFQQLRVADLFNISLPIWASVKAFLSHPVTLLSFTVAIFSATQDIALDAYRRELLPDIELGLGNSVHVNAYKIAGLVPGSLSLMLADHMTWDSVFMITALFMLPGIIMTLLVSEPILKVGTPKTLRAAVVEPFKEFVGRNGANTAIMILAFIFLYKLGDSMATALATPFYLDMGFSKTEIGLIAKNAGLWPSVIGGLLGGIWMIQLGINRSLWIFGVIQMVAILGFAWIASIANTPEFASYFSAHVFSPLDSVKSLNWVWVDIQIPKRLLWLGMVIGVEAFGVGLGTAAFVAYIAQTTHPLYTATQFALFTSLAAVPRTFANAGTGYMVEQLGWTKFFLVCFILAVPGMLLLIKIAPWNTKKEDEAPLSAS